MPLLSQVLVRYTAALLLLVLTATGCTGGTRTQPSTSAPAVAASKGGTYKGTVKRGHAITFSVSPNGKEVSKVHANVLESCTSSSSTRTITFYMEGPFAIGSDGTLTVEEQDPETKYTSRFTATVNKDGTASGTLIQKGAFLGTACTTYELTWTAQKQ